MTTSKKKENIGFEEAFQKLERIVESLEKGESTLDAAMKSFEEGMAMAKLCAEKLNMAESRLQELIKNENGSFQLDFMD